METRVGQRAVIQDRTGKMISPISPIIGRAQTGRDHASATSSMQPGPCAPWPSTTFLHVVTADFPQTTSLSPDRRSGPSGPARPKIAECRHSGLTEITTRDEAFICRWADACVVRHPAVKRASVPARGGKRVGRIPRAASSCGKDAETRTIAREIPIPQWWDSRPVNRPGSSGRIFRKSTSQRKVSTTNASTRILMPRALYICRDGHSPIV